MNEIKPVKDWVWRAKLTSVEAEIERGETLIAVTLNVKEAEMLRCVAALCLHGQPFGFTREEVALLRRVSNSDDFWEDRRFDDLADRIAALLPPEDLS